MISRGSAAVVLALVALCSPGAVQDQSELRASETKTPATLVPLSYRLWPGKAPGSQGEGEADIPTLTMFRPQGPPNGSAVIIAPGGAYVGLASVLEGSQPAEWFAARGVTAFVLTYRVGPAARLPTVLQDGARAIRFVRYHAQALEIVPDRIGMMGFSAGGHLAASVAVDMPREGETVRDAIDRVSSRPDYLVLGYPWLEGTRLSDEGTSQYCDFAAFLQVPCQPADYAQYRPVEFVTSAAPPTFIYHTTNDELVPVGGSVAFFSALHENGVDAELHAYEKGRHGTGLGGADSALAEWTEALDRWLRARGLLGAGIAGEATPEQGRASPTE